MYALVGATVAYGAYRRGRAPLISAILRPIFGDRTEGWIGAVIDVFATEPTTESPLFEHESVVVTPHLGASTSEAQDRAGTDVASMPGAPAPRR